jgi:hypothetical protein
MYCDNQSIIAQLMKKNDNSKSNKHIKHTLKFARKMKTSRVIVVNYVKSESNLVGPFYKGISTECDVRDV